MEDSKLDTLSGDAVAATTAASTTTSEKNSSFRWLVNWVVLLTTVFLFASSLNCLFLWLAYGFRYDAAALAFSLLLALMVYFVALHPNRMASLQKKLLFSVSVLAIWAIFMPIVMRLAGFH